jgi:alpha-ketoglutarate-dependent taurine dioxygenase
MTSNSKHEKEQYLLDPWGSTFEGMTYEEMVGLGFEYWYSKLVERKFVAIRGLDPNMSDQALFRLGQLFGKVWAREEYSASTRVPDTPHDFDPTWKNNKEALRDDTPVSYFYSDKTMFNSRYMAYHSDMPHPKASGNPAFPVRALFMVRTTNNHSGKTTWLDMEEGWSQMTAEERAMWDGVEVIQQHMYKPGTAFERFPALKYNPWTGRPSLRLNCMRNAPNGNAWLRLFFKDGKGLPLIESLDLLNKTYQILESKPNSMIEWDWKDGDLLVYHNWPSVHRRTEVTLEEGEEKRKLKRLTINVPWPEDFKPQGYQGIIKNPTMQECIDVDKERN